jgi:hypothetical protein
MVRRGDIFIAMRLKPTSLVAAAALLLSGCASLGAAEDADTRKLTWFSYVNGEDLRAQCSHDGPDRYRLIYNSKSSAQLRTYEVQAASGEGKDGQSGGGGAVVDARIIPAEAMWKRDPEDTLETEQVTTMRLYLSPDQFEQLTLRLAETGVFDGPAMGFHMETGGVFWLASGCHDGTYFLTAFSNPSDRFENIGMSGQASGRH